MASHSYLLAIGWPNLHVFELWKKTKAPQKKPLQLWEDMFIYYTNIFLQNCEPHTLTCCADEAEAHSAACSAGTRGKGTARWAYQAGCAPAGWQNGTVAMPLAAGPRGRSPVHTRSCSGTAGSMCVHTACPQAGAVAVDIYDTPTHHPPRPGTHKHDYLGSRGTAHTLCTPVPRSCYPATTSPSAPPWSCEFYSL